MFMFVPRAIGRHRRNLFALAPDYLRKKETTEPTSRLLHSGHGSQVMLEASKFSAVETLRDGRKIEIRALKSDDRAGLIAAVGRSSTQSLYRRFFGVKREFSEKEIAFFVNIDFVKHVALVAVAEEGGQGKIVGGGRYVLVRPGTAEVAFAVIDEYQGQGIGLALMRHLVTLARGAKLKEFIAEVLPDNTAMLKVFEKCGLELKKRRDRQVVYVTLQL